MRQDTLQVTASMTYFYVLDQLAQFNCAAYLTVWTEFERVREGKTGLSLYGYGRVTLLTGLSLYGWGVNATGRSQWNV